jgi:hypothetical protein
MVLATITMHTDCRPARAACSGCQWAEEEASQSPDMQDVLRGHAVEHAKGCLSRVDITVTSVFSVAPAGVSDDL